MPSQLAQVRDSKSSKFTFCRLFFMLHASCSKHLISSCPPLGTSHDPNMDSCRSSSLHLSSSGLSSALNLETVYYIAFLAFLA